MKHAICVALCVAYASGVGATLHHVNPADRSFTKETPWVRGEPTIILPIAWRLSTLK